MGTDTDRLSFKPDNDDLPEGVERYQARHGLEYRSDALEELVEIGLRETRSPILYRLKDEVINWAGWLGVFAVIVLAAGFVTPYVSVLYGALLAGTLAIFAVLLVAALELGRILTGQSELGAVVWSVIR
jgi:hypothetical protein